MYRLRATPVYIGSQPARVQDLARAIAEVIAYHGTIAPADLTTLESYLLQKFNIPHHP